MTDEINMHPEISRTQANELLNDYRSRLTRMVQLRMDSRLRRRLDASDVIQEAYIDVDRRLEDYERHREKMSFFVWVRFLVNQKIVDLHRKHLKVKARNAAREVSVDFDPSPQASSAHLATQLSGQLTSPSNNAIREEQRLQIRIALERLDPIDREILALHHYEQLTMSECADVLSIQLTAACNRYVRALKRFKKTLEKVENV